MGMLLGRTYVGLYILNYSSPNPASTWSDMTGNVLRWGGNWAAREIDELDGSCKWTGNWMTTRYGGIFVDEWTEVHTRGGFQLVPVARAASILHEARHAHGEDDAKHDGNDGTNRCLDGGSSCDENYSGSWSGRANSIEAWFMSWYYSEAVNTTSFQKQIARTFGNWNLDSRFDNDPNWNI